MNIIKRFKLSICTLLFILSALNFVPALNAVCDCHNHERSEDSLTLGIDLETEYWKLVQKQKVDKFSRKLASIFQGLNVSGVYSREQQIAGLTGATLTNFIINNPVATRLNDILVFSYDFIAVESDLTSGPSLTIWKKSKCSWKIVSHSYVPFANNE